MGLVESFGALALETISQALPSSRSKNQVIGFVALFLLGQIFHIRVMMQLLDGEEERKNENKREKDEETTPSAAHSHRLTNCSL